MLNRRRFLAGAAGLAAAAGTFPAPALAQARPRVVVIGGGAGGASVVRRLAAAAPGALDIALVEPEEVYTTCFYSNLYLGGFQSLDVLQHRYDAFAALPGVSLVRGRAASINLAGRRVTLEGGDTLDYDRVVVAPGIDLDYASVPGWSRKAEVAMPHAWQAGPQTELLKRQIDAVPDGGLVVVIAPPNPYRCPPGPYERVSMIAHALMSSGRGGARIVVIDAKDKFSKQPLFQQGWEKHYPGMVEWLPPTIHGGIDHVEPETMSVATGFETYKGAALVNVIPRQVAGSVARQSGLAVDGGWCPVDAFTMKSQHDDNVFVLGDAAIAGDMPKSAFAANSQAQVVAEVLAAELLEPGKPEIAYRNRCWSLIATDDSVMVGGDYRPTEEKIEQTQSVISGLEDSPETRRRNYEDSAGWYAGLTAEMFG